MQTKVRNHLKRRAAEAASQPAKARKRRAKAKSEAGQLVAALGKALGHMVVGGDDDPNSIEWEWKWELYRDFRKAFTLARDDGLVIVSI